MEYVESWKGLRKRADEAFPESGWFDAYTTLKVVFIVRFYISGGTYGEGQNEAEVVGVAGLVYHSNKKIKEKLK
jgi:hypothetical protein